MRVLFVCSGNKFGKPGILVKNQGDSLIKNEIEIEYFVIIGKGIVGYLKNIPRLRNYLRMNSFHIIHAHYSLSAFVATLAGAKPLMVSLMGSDTYMSWYWRIIIKLFYHFFWDKTIVKSERMKELLKLKNAIVIPNGVDLDQLKELDKKGSQKKVGFIEDKTNIIFLADPNRVEKNYCLAKKSVEKINNSNFELHTVYNIPFQQVVDYLNAADILLLTSIWEGSVNVVKEAMACNLPIVSVDVGDVKQNIEGIDGCFICKNSAEDIADKIKFATVFSKKFGRTKGREHIIKLGLDSNNIAIRIINLYKSVIN